MTAPLRLALAGVGIAHSPSPHLHRQLLALSGLVGDSRLLDGVPWAEVEAQLRSGELAGASVTTPYKRAAAAAIDRWPGYAAVDGAPRPRSVNTVWRREQLLWGTSTDGPGLAEVLTHLQPWSGQTVWILGTGGAALALAQTLVGLGARVWVTGRDTQAARALAAAVGCRSADWGQPVAGATLVIHASRWGHGQSGAPELATWAWLPWAQWRAQPIELVDIVYARAGLTWFEQQAQRLGIPPAVPGQPGLRAGAGLHMLLAQAALAFAAITGQRHDWRRLTTST
ncbi:MAG: hypothetical protein HY902_10940 [Deltaproteobacteria bacterium]|nr:hypothetical protein [Deltaproteobacteria bacterium]